MLNDDQNSFGVGGGGHLIWKDLMPPETLLLWSHEQQIWI